MSVEPTESERPVLRPDDDPSAEPLLDGDSPTIDAQDLSTIASSTAGCDSEVDRPAEPVSLPSEESVAEANEFTLPILEHPTLQALSRLQEQGKHEQARIGYQNLADSIEQSKADHGSLGEAIWLEATRCEFETSLLAQQPVQAMAKLRQRYRRFEQPTWTRLREDTQRYYQQMISMSVDVGLEEQALEVFEQVRAHVTLTPDLRQKLLEASIRLGRVDPGTAQLCIDEAFSRKLDPHEFESLMQLIREAIRIDLLTPSNELIAEFIRLNTLVRRQTDLRWPIGHLAMAAWRQKRSDEAVNLCREAGKPSGTDAHTACLIGTGFYLGRQFAAARDWFVHANKQNDSEHGLLAGFLKDLVHLNRLIITGSHQLRKHDADSFKRVLVGRLAGVLQRDVPAQWRLDASWLTGCAQVFLGQVEHAIESFADLPYAFATWKTAECVHETLRTHQSAEDAEAWLARLEPEKPLLTSLVRAKQAIAHFQFEDAAKILALVREAHAQELAGDSDLRSTVKCLSAELQLASAQPDLPINSAIEPSCQDWSERLGVRRLIGLSEFGEAARQLEKSAWFTTPPIERNRLAAVLSFARDPDETSIGTQFERLASDSAAQPVDRLHLSLWKARSTPEQALPELEELLTHWPGCLELELAVIRCRLAGKTVDEKSSRDLEKTCNLSNWQNRESHSWIRPWQEFVPAGASVSSAVVTPARVADVLQASDLQRQCGQLEESVRTLEHLEKLVGEDSAALQAPIAERLLAAAELVLTQEDWELACEWHQKALRHGADHGDFAERLAQAFADADTAPEAVMNVLFEWMSRFEGSEEQFLAADTGRTFDRFTRITADVPEGAHELVVRRDWVHRLATAKPEWDLPKRSLASAAARDGDDETVVATVRSLKRRDKSDEELLGNALWNLRRFAEADEAFRTAQTPGWTGCARAAARFATMETDGEWLSDGEADELLDLLDPVGLDAGAAMRVHEWRISVLVGARRGDVALASFDQLEGADWLNPLQMHELRGLALLLAGRIEEACACFCPQDVWGGELTVDRVTEHRRGLGLFLLVQLARPTRDDLPQLQRALLQLRKLNETSPAFVLAEAQFALLRADPEEADWHFRRLMSSDGKGSTTETVPKPAEQERRPAAEELLLAPLMPLVRAESGFVDGRIRMQRLDFVQAATMLEENTRRRLWPEPNHYWRAVALAYAGQTEAAVPLLEEFCASHPKDASAPAQLAALSLQRGDFDTAGAWATRALERDSEHPFAMLIQGQIEEHTGELEQATRRFEELVSGDALIIGRRVQAAAHLALGRIAQTDTRLDDAVEHFRSAQRLEPKSPIAVRRLGLILAVNAQSAEEWQEADTFLETIECTAPSDPLVLLGRICSADALGQTEVLAERLEQLIELDAFDQIPTEVQCDLSLLSADTQLRQKKYGAAATALERLRDQAPSEQVESRLRQCRLLEALQLVSQRPMPDQAIEQVRMAAEAVCATDSPPPHAVLLRIIGTLLAGGLSADEERSAARDEIAGLQFVDSGLGEVAAIAKLWLGDDSGNNELSERLSSSDGQALRQCVELIAASLNRKAGRFRDEALRLASGEASPDELPFDADEVVFVGVLAGGKKDRDWEESCAVLEEWHGQGRGNDSTRLLHSQLLAHGGVKALKKKRFGLSRKLLQQAINVTLASQR